jgi:hypothetical protein
MKNDLINQTPNLYLETHPDFWSLNLGEVVQFRILALDQI